MKTKVSINGNKFYINDKLTYSELPNSNPDKHGLLMNARFIQGIFDDSINPHRFARYGVDRWDAEQNTDKLIEALPEWYSYGLRAFTVGLQGGGPCFTMTNDTICCNPFGEDGSTIDARYLARLERLINAADELGMVVIISYFYGAQARRIKDDNGIINATKIISNWLRDKGFSNIIIEVANENAEGNFKVHPIIYTDEGMCELMELARRESGGMIVGCSGMGVHFSEKILVNSDCLFIHGNRLTRGQLYEKIKRAKSLNTGKPIISNEDSQDIGNMRVCMNEGVSWGYYNNATKQEVPTYWGVLDGEDKFFASRMAIELGIDVAIGETEYLQGLEATTTTENQRWVRLASLYPERIDYVEFYRNDEHVYTAYDEPFLVNAISNWRQSSVENIEGEARWQAIIHFSDGSTKTIVKIITDGT